jgi:hypothetical protein
MDHMYYDDGSIQTKTMQNFFAEVVRYFEQKSAVDDLHRLEVEFVATIEHTVGTDPDEDDFNTPYSKYLETLVGSDDRLNTLGDRLMELSTVVSELDATYGEVYAADAEELFEEFSTARI